MAITATESIQYANISATTAAFTLKGGKYIAVVVAGGFGTVVDLETLANDGSTWLSVGNNFAANGTQMYDLPPGQYRVGITGASGVYFELTRVPA
jgi:roadblock/LC7 domain-containing protein